ncbi:hypothetical protein BOW94_gp01 [Escherichia phage GA2A]|uniref:Uncharacterized protein n=1 Tax=Escherichia phage GA2A TaxID=1755695 RepID=A0A1B0TR25_9CAUD|nr:hypothetical protein BOW94_gp01 [Escherichia phage GA2A]ALP47766.1 hypothetical protein GA2A_01 [Escherichia phage GA2A]
MKIIAMNEELGVIWYTATDYKYRTKHVIIYGLTKTEHQSRKQAQDEFNKCLDHAFNCR